MMLLQTRRRNNLELISSANGFSLLELLFIVAILATLATFGLSMYRQRAINAKAVRAAGEIQQVLQAASAFYIDKGEWPVGQTKMGEEFESNYLPFGKIRQSPWSAGYDYKPFLTTTGHLGKARLFQVETTVPTIGVASQLAAQLPNAEIENLGNNLYKVKAQIAIPGQDQGISLGSYVIAEIGEIGSGKPGTDERSRYLNARLQRNNRSRKVEFSCPETMKRAMFAAISGVDSGGWANNRDKSYTTTLATFEIEPINCDSQGCEIKLSLGYWSVNDCTTTPTCWPEDTYAKIQYIAYCQPQ